MSIFSDECYGFLRPDGGSVHEDPEMQAGRGRGTTHDTETYTPGGGTILRDGIYTTGKNILDRQISRRKASGYAPLRRAVSLIAGAGARILTNGMMRIETSVGGKRVDPTGIEQDLLLKIAESVDGGRTASRIFFEDCFADYCFTGNALIGFGRSMRGEIGDMERLRVTGAQTEMTAEGMLYGTYDDEGHLKWRSERNVIHCRWPDLEGAFSERPNQYYNRSRRDYPFAQSPILTQGHPLTIAVLMMESVADYYASPPPDLGLNINKELIGQVLKFPQIKETVDDAQAQYRKVGKLFATGGADVKKFSLTPLDRVPEEILTFVLRDVSRIYGVPTILLEELADRVPGTMVEQLANQFWKFGLKDHVGRFVDPMSLRLVRRGHRLVADEIDFLQGNVTLKDALVAALGGGQGSKANSSREEVRRMIGLPRDMDPDDTMIEAQSITPSDGGSPRRAEDMPEEDD